MSAIVNSFSAYQPRNILNLIVILIRINLICHISILCTNYEYLKFTKEFLSILHPRFASSNIYLSLEMIFPIIELCMRRNIRRVPMVIQAE